MRSRARWPPAKARCSWSTPPRASRRRRSPTSTRRIDANHEIVPVLNKIDLPAAEPDRIKEQIEEVIGIDASDAVPISAKTGLNIEGVLEAIVKKLPPPKGDRERAAEGASGRFLVRCLSRRGRAGAHHRRRAEEGHDHPMMGTDAAYGVDRVGVFTPKMLRYRRPRPGRGRLLHRLDQGSRRYPRRRHDHRRPQADGEALPGFKPVQPVVFCGLFPVDAADFENLRAAMGKLRLNDASFSYEMETSAALGFGFRCGFLGLLHLEIIQERLEREFNLDLISTAPSRRLSAQADRRHDAASCTIRPTCRT